MKKNIEALDKHLMQLKSNINNGYYGGASVLLRDALHELDIIKAKANGVERSSEKCHIQSVSNSVCPHPKAATVGVGTYEICKNCGGIKMLAN